MLLEKATEVAQSRADRVDLRRLVLIVHPEQLSHLAHLRDPRQRHLAGDAGGTRIIAITFAGASLIPGIAAEFANEFGA